MNTTGASALSGSPCLTSSLGVSIVSVLSVMALIEASLLGLSASETS